MKTTEKWKKLFWKRIWDPGSQSKAVTLLIINYTISIESKVDTEIIFFRKMRGIYAHAAFAPTTGTDDDYSFHIHERQCISSTEFSWNGRARRSLYLDLRAHGSIEDRDPLPACKVVSNVIHWLYIQLSHYLDESNPLSLQLKALYRSFAILTRPLYPIPNLVF